MVRNPLSIQDFKEIRQSDYYYVDKSAMIDDVIGENGSKVFLFTRPRRFGKSLNLSMLDAYLNMEYAGNTWFDGLEISRFRPGDPEKNAHPVIYLDMKNLGNGTYLQFIYKIRLKMVDLYIKTLNLTNKEELKKNPGMLFPNIESVDGYMMLASSLLNLVEKLYDSSGKKVIILIDEYDNAVNNARTDTKAEEDTDRRKILDFIKLFLTDVLKGCEYTHMAVLTGVMKIGKESIFSGMNNLRVDSIFSTPSDERFGFTPEEVRKLCFDFGHPEKYEETKEWYDGYRFGDAEIYNPWSLFNYIAEGFKPDSYWAGTSGNSIINTLMDNLGGIVFEDFQKMARGDEVAETISNTVVYSDVEDGGDEGDLFSVMVMSGYLRAVRQYEQEYLVSIPNKEMRMIFSRMFTKRTGVGKRIRNLLNAVQSGDADAVSASLEDLVRSLDSKILNHEHIYEVFCIAMLFNLEGPYEVTGEFQAGKGYGDIRLKSNRGNLPHIIMELKQTRNENEDLNRLAESGIEQIREKDYAHTLKGTVIMYGIAFHKTNVSVRGDKMVL